MELIKDVNAKIMQTTAELALQGLVEIEEDGSSFGLTEKGMGKAKDIMQGMEFQDWMLVMLALKYGMDKIFERTGEDGYTE